MAQGYAHRWLAMRAYALVADAVLSSSALADAWTIEGRVVAIADGDTITVLDRDKCQHKIRLNDIDAPEKGQPFGDCSRRHLALLVASHPPSSWGHRACRLGLPQTSKIFT